MTAIISKCENYRYRLDRDIGMLDELVVAYFGINPSTADAHINDHTVRKWIGFSKIMGASKFIVGNVFGYRSKKVASLASVTDPIGPDNPYYLDQIIADADILVPCWGSRNKLPKQLRPRLDWTLETLRESGKSVMVFGLTESGDPMHPLNLSYETRLVHFT